MGEQHMKTKISSLGMAAVLACSVAAGVLEYKFGDVNVTSFRGVVQLSGFVNTSDQKRVAGSIAEKVEHVKRVENNISIKERSGG
jgi:hypothetical protein